MFCVPGLIFGGAEGDEFRFHVLRSRRRFPRYRGRRVPFSNFALLDSFSAILRASGPDFKFCAPGLVFGNTAGIGNRFHVLRLPRTSGAVFQVLISSFPLPDSFSMLSRASGPDFMCLRSRTCFRWYRGRRLPFSCFVLPDSFSAVSRTSAPVFMFCTLGHVFDSTGSVGSRFHVLCARNYFRQYRGRPVPFSCFALPDSFFGGIEGVGSRFHFLRARTRYLRYRSVGSHFHVSRDRTSFWRYGRRRVPFSCFGRPDSFSAETRVSGPVLKFCTLGHVFGGTAGIRFHLHVLRPRTRFRRYGRRRVPFSCFALLESLPSVPRVSGPVFKFCAPGLIFNGTAGIGSRFHVLRSRTCFRRYRRLQLPFSCFARPDSFSAVPRASGPDFMFCAFGLILGGTEGVGSRFHVLHARARFRRYRRHQVPISCFAIPVSFSAVPRASGPIFMFCASGLVFGSTEGVGTHFHLLRAVRPFFACSAPPLGDEMRKKDTEIPP
jgi:hypothetical protein